jgi:hypothetical protein
VLAPALEGFAPTSEMPEIAEAQALLAALAETEEVKAEATQRRRMTHLRVAYGHALIATRGYGAPETTEAFTAARESTHGDNAAPERLAADYDLWVGSYVRGELAAARAHAAAFRRAVQARPDSPTAVVAHRVLGATHWSAGEYVEARDHLERALALFEPTRDDDLAKTPALRQCFTLRSHCGRWATSNGRLPSLTQRRRGSRGSRMSRRARTGNPRGRCLN